MGAKPQSPVIAMTGLAFEARIAKGAGVLSISGTQPDTPEYSTGAVPITVPMAGPADREHAEPATGGAR